MSNIELEAAVLKATGGDWQFHRLERIHHGAGKLTVRSTRPVTNWHGDKAVMFGCIVIPPDVTEQSLAVEIETFLESVRQMEAGVRRGVFAPTLGDSVAVGRLSATVRAIDTVARTVRVRFHIAGMDDADVPLAEVRPL